MPKLFKIWSKGPILNNISKYHVIFSFFDFWLSILITYFSHLSSPSISTLNHFSLFHPTPLLPFSLSLQPLHSLIPYPPILSHISIYGGGGHPPKSFTLLPHLPHPRSHYLHFPPSLLSSTFIPFPPNYSQSSSGSWTPAIPHSFNHLTFPSLRTQHAPNSTSYTLPFPLHHPYPSTTYKLPPPPPISLPSPYLNVFLK
jgi:hypothetical protein